MAKKERAWISNKYLEAARDLVLRDRDNGNLPPPIVICNFISKDIDPPHHHFSEAHGFIYNTFRRHLLDIDPMLWDAMKRNKYKYTRMKLTIQWDQGHTTLVSTSSSSTNNAIQPTHNSSPPRIYNLRSMPTVDERNPSSSSDQSVDNGGQRQSIVHYGWLQERPELLCDVINVCDSLGLHGSHHPSTPKAQGIILGAEGSYDMNESVNVHQVKYLKQHFGKDIQSESNGNNQNNNGTVLRYHYGTGCGAQTSGVNPWYVDYMLSFIYTYAIYVSNMSTVILLLGNLRIV